MPGIHSPLDSAHSGFLLTAWANEKGYMFSVIDAALALNLDGGCSATARGWRRANDYRRLAATRRPNNSPGRGSGDWNARNRSSPATDGRIGERTTRYSAYAGRNRGANCAAGGPNPKSNVPGTLPMLCCILHNARIAALPVPDRPDHSAPCVTRGSRGTVQWQNGRQRRQARAAAP